MTRSLFMLSLWLGASQVAHAQVPPPVTNLAAGKPTDQTSIHEGAQASRAVDGITDGNWLAGSTTSTAIDTLHPWWQVDLQSVQDIGTVTIFNRTDCCADRLKNFVVKVSPDGGTWFDIPYPGVAGAKVAIPVARQGRYVRIQLLGTGTLSLAEVQVSPMKNVAKGKPATQSTTHEGATADRAVDGNTSGVYTNLSVTSTGLTEATPPWWKVDLGVAQMLGQVVLYNRTDCCAERLTNFTVGVSKDGTNWVNFPYIGTVAQSTTILLNQVGRYVRVQLNAKGILSLAEVQVSAVKNLAVGKPATQSTSYGGAVAARAVDGNTDGNWANGSVTSTNIDTLQPWWQVDLQSVQQVGTVVLHNRTDCCSTRLANFKVSTSENGTTWKEYQQVAAAGPRTNVPVNAATRYVKVQLLGTGTLSLAEVEVFEMP